MEGVVGHAQHSSALHLNAEKAVQSVVTAVVVVALVVQQSLQSNLDTRRIWHTLLSYISFVAIISIYLFIAFQKARLFLCYLLLFGCIFEHGSMRFSPNGLWRFSPVAPWATGWRQRCKSQIWRGSWQVSSTPLWSPQHYHIGKHYRLTDCFIYQKKKKKIVYDRLTEGLLFPKTKSTVFTWMRQKPGVTNPRLKQSHVNKSFIIHISHRTNRQLNLK